jgi:uncharacterized protein with HEPN domain
MRYLVEMAAATDRLASAATRGDQRRYTDDDLYRFAIAFLWLRLAEPATRLLTLRLVDEQALPVWGVLTTIRNSLAHQLDEEIAYGRLWTELPDTIQTVNDDLDLLLAS